MTGDKPEQREESSNSGTPVHRLLPVTRHPDASNDQIRDLEPRSTFQPSLDIAKRPESVQLLWGQLDLACSTDLLSKLDVLGPPGLQEIAVLLDQVGALLVRMACAERILQQIANH